MRLASASRCPPRSLPGRAEEPFDADGVAKAMICRKLVRAEVLPVLRSVQLTSRPHGQGTDRFASRVIADSQKYACNLLPSNGAVTSEQLMSSFATGLGFITIAVVEAHMWQQPERPHKRRAVGAHGGSIHRGVPEQLVCDRWYLMLTGKGLKEPLWRRHSLVSPNTTLCYGDCRGAQQVPAKRHAHLGSNVHQGHVIGIAVKQEDVAVGAVRRRWARIWHNDPAVAPFDCTCRASGCILGSDRHINEHYKAV